MAINIATLVTSNNVKMKYNKLVLFLILAGALSVPSCEPDKKIAEEIGNVSNNIITTADIK
jgi:hypothetical protein